MKDLIYIIGHKNPDTDSICSAIGYSYYKNKALKINTIPVRLSDINKETEFVLDYFNVKLPEKINTVKMQIKDVGIDMVDPIQMNISIRSAWNIMKENNIKSLPIVNQFGKLIGISTLSDLTNSYIDISSNNLLSKSKTSSNNVIETLKGKHINSYKCDFANTNNIIIAAMDLEEVKKRINSKDIVIVGNRSDIIQTAIENGAACVIITGGYVPDYQLVKNADENNCMLISVNYDTFMTSKLINSSIPVSFVMTNENLISFDFEDYVDEIKETMLETRYRAYPVLLENKVIGTISRYHLIKNNRKKVILVDHNERAQSVNGLDEAEIIEIIDHHRVGDIETNSPIYFINRPLGSTATIVGNMLLESGVFIEPNIAGILCAAIISDTLLFKSPTSTIIDEEIAHKLSQIAGINIKEFSNLMFKAGSTIIGKSLQEIFYQDFKEFNIGKKKIGISQVITMDFESIDLMKDKFIMLINNLQMEKRYDHIIFMITDIIKEGSEFIFTDSSKELISNSFNIRPDKNNVFIDGIISRKKQVIPLIANSINNQF